MTAPDAFTSLLSACGAPGTGGDGKGAVFAEPWQAETVATTLHLSRSGQFSWSEWVECFSRHIADHPQRPDEDANTAYYRQWLSALEAMLAGRQILAGVQIAEAQEDWRRSYLHTEHGKPVHFRRGLPQPDIHDHGHDHDHHHHHVERGTTPISISPARHG